MIQKRQPRSKSARLRYYAASAWTVLTHLRLPMRAVALLFSGAAARPVRVRFRSSPLQFLVRDRMDVWMLKEVCLDRDYERVGVPLQNGWAILDVGAGIGEFAVAAAARQPAAVVHAFEPSAAAFNLLLENIRLNAVGNVRPYAVALSNRSGRGRLDASARSTASHRLVGEHERRSPGQDNVLAMTLEDALVACGMDRCDFLKMDCEGSEYDVVRGASSSTLAKIGRICLEYHDGPDHHHDELVARLTAEGFRVRLTPNPAYQDIGFLYASRS